MWPDLLEHPPCSVSFWSPPGDGKTAEVWLSRAVRWPKAVKAPEMKQTIFLWELWSSSHTNPMRNEPGPSTDLENWSDKQVSLLPGGKLNPLDFWGAQKVPPTWGYLQVQPWARLLVAPSPLCPPGPGQVLPARGGRWGGPTCLHPGSCLQPVLPGDLPTASVPIAEAAPGSSPSRRGWSPEVSALRRGSSSEAGAPPGAPAVPWGVPSGRGAPCAARAGTSPGVSPQAAAGR